MIWSLLKVGIFFCLAAALAWGAGFVLDDPGEVRMSFAGQEFLLQPLDFIVALAALLILFWLLLKLAGLLVAVLRFFAGGETAIARWDNRQKERRGFDALREAMIAISAGEGRPAVRFAEKADKLLERPALTHLVNAQAAELAGNPTRAEAHYRQLLEDDKTRFVGILGLMRRRLSDGKPDVARKLAEKAFALKPTHAGVIDTLFELQTGAADWRGARDTLKAKVKARLLPRDVGARRDAVLALALARKAEAEGQIDTAQNAAAEAIALAPGLVPAAVTAAHLKAQGSDPKAGERILRRAWETAPHPELAAAFAELTPNEDPEARRKRFQTLLSIHSGNPYTRMLATELALAAEDFPAARRALGDLAETRPTARVLALAAAIERGEGAADRVVRGFLARALSAPRGEQWVCEVCGHVHSSWSPVCENCGAFDSLTWQQPGQPAAGETESDAALPVIIGGDEVAGTDEAPTTVDGAVDGAVDLAKVESTEPNRAA
ncbi:MAG: heme biosynthesis HemY N-terminal domain-containing protein [Pseudomonadota bacterium]